MSVEIIKRHIPVNFTRDNFIPKYIVLHDTGNASPSANAAAHQKYFCDPSAKASYNYVCDEKQVIECVPVGSAAYHAGVGRSGIRLDGKYSLITNYNSIGVSYCICKGSDIAAAIENAAQVTAMLCAKYGLGTQSIVRHFDATDKLCPNTMYIDGKWDKFSSFKLRVSDIMREDVEVESILNALTARGIVTDREYWKRALSGTGEISPKWLRVLLLRAIGQ